MIEQETYFLAAIEKMLLQPDPTPGLWPLLNTWTEMVKYMPDQTALHPAWIKAITTLGFAGNDYQIRLAAFDSFLEMCESLIEEETTGASQ
jgi:hypothetical protein